MSWKFNSQMPVSLQIVYKLRLDILNGVYPAGSQFPSVRQLAYSASVNPNTMQKALTALENEGLLITCGTVGRFVTEDEGILLSAKRKIQEEYVKKVLDGAEVLGITREMFAEYISENKSAERNDGNG